MNFLDAIFGGGGQQGYGDAANSIQQGIDAMRNSYAQGRDVLQPFYNAGTSALPQYQNLLESMKNPVQFYNGVMDQYNGSPQYNFEMQQMQKAMNQAAAAGGTLGSPSQQQALAQYAQGLSSEDMQRFFGNIMGVQGQYQTGLGNLINTGQNAANTINGNFMNQGNNEGMLYNAKGNAELGAAQSQAAGDQGLFSSIFNLPSMITQGVNGFKSLGNLFTGAGGNNGNGITNPSAFYPSMQQFATSLF